MAGNRQRYCPTTKSNGYGTPAATGSSSCYKPDCGLEKIANLTWPMVLDPGGEIGSANPAFPICAMP